MIELKNVSFSYSSSPDTNSLDGIDLTVPTGQMLLITGASGCGKSTLLRLLNGLIPHYYEGVLSGEVLYDNKRIRDMQLYETAAIQGTVFQNPRSQFFTVDTTGELAFGCENMGIEPDKILNRIEQTVKAFHIADLMGRSIFQLSGGEKQKIACASIDTMCPELILLDEPSANLDFSSTMRLREIILQWKNSGKTIIAVEHRISYLWALADRTVIMQNGRIYADLDRSAMDKMTDEMLIAKGLRTLGFTDPVACDVPEIQSNDELIRIKAQKKLQFPESIPLHEITVIVGSNGAGKTTFLDRLCRSKEYRKRVFLVMQDVNHQLFTESLLEEITISLDHEDKGQATAILKSVGLEEYAERHPVSLSGGQKQRAAIACAVASGRDILLFDEPTSGLDRAHMEQTAELFKELQKQGKTVVVVTHDSELIELCATRKIIMKRGELHG